MKNHPSQHLVFCRLCGEFYNAYPPGTPCVCRNKKTKEMGAIK